MSESVNNNQIIEEEENQGEGAPAPEEPQQNTVILETSSSTVGPEYCQNLVIELMKQIPPIPPEGPTKPDDVADRVAKCNPRTYEVSTIQLNLKRIRGMEKIFVIVEVPENKKVNIGTFYLAGEADIWWNTVKGRWHELELTWAKFTGELRAQFLSNSIAAIKRERVYGIKDDW